jgi:hypothetical protein
MSQKITKADTTHWIAPFYAEPRPVLVSPNPVFVSNSGTLVLHSWLCDHVAPQTAMEEDEVIACASCIDALHAGADIVKECEF